MADQYSITVVYTDAVAHKNYPTFFSEVENPADGSYFKVDVATSSVQWYTPDDLTKGFMKEVTIVAPFIDRDAFHFGFDNLEFVTWITEEWPEDTPCFIGRNAFSGCRKLKGMVFPPTLTFIGYGAFMECIALETVSLEHCSNLRKIPVKCFEGCVSLTSVSVPQNCSVIMKQAFMHCHRLQDFNFPNSTYTLWLERQAFKYCTGFRHITLPQRVWIELEAFAHCENLVSVNFVDAPDTVMTIDREDTPFARDIKRNGILTLFKGDTKNDQFKGCSKLRYVDINPALAGVIARTITLTLGEYIANLSETPAHVWFPEIFPDCPNLALDEVRQRTNKIELKNLFGFRNRYAQQILLNAFERRRYEDDARTAGLVASTVPELPRLPNEVVFMILDYVAAIIDRNALQFPERAPAVRNPIALANAAHFGSDDGYLRVVSDDEED